MASRTICIFHERSVQLCANSKVSLSLSLNIFFPLFVVVFSCDALLSRISIDAADSFSCRFLSSPLSLSLSLEFARNFRHPRTHRTVSFNVLTTRYSPCRAYIETGEVTRAETQATFRNFGQFRVYSNRINMRSTCARLSMFNMCDSLINYA